MLKTILTFLLGKYRFRFLTEKKIKRFQLKKTQDIVNYALKHSKFYSQFYNEHDTNDVFNLPRINKTIFMENFTDLNTAGLTKKECLDFCLENEKTRDFSKRLKGYTVGMSSGTSGNKGIEVVSSEEEEILQTIFFSRFPMLKNEKINAAFILRVFSPGFDANMYGHKIRYVSPLRPIEEIVKQLESQKPNILSAPPSMLEILAREVEDGRLNINLKRVISYAEVLAPDIQKHLEKVFKTDVHEIYKCTEGAIALSCRFGRLHINEDIIALQLKDSQGNPTPPGEPCHQLVITDLVKKTTPIINYELNDIITIDPQPCPCGSKFRVIKQIQGRADDMFLAPRIDKDEMHFIFGDYIRRSIITVSDDILNYQAIQTDPLKIVVKIEMNNKKKSVKKSDKDKSALLNSITNKIILNIQSIFAKYHCIMPEIEIRYGKVLYDPDRKFRRIQREFSTESSTESSRESST